MGVLKSQLGSIDGYQANNGLSSIVFTLSVDLCYFTLYALYNIHCFCIILYNTCMLHVHVSVTTVSTTLPLVIHLLNVFMISYDTCYHY